MRSKACSRLSSVSETTTAARHTFPWTCDGDAGPSAEDAAWCGEGKRPHHFAVGVQERNRLRHLAEAESYVVVADQFGRSREASLGRHGVCVARTAASRPAAALAARKTAAVRAP
jgi:hypothetical protein